VNSATYKEGLKVARLLMVLSSVSPLFLLWAIRGSTLVPDVYFVSFCLFMIVAPNIFLLLRIATAKKHNDKRELSVGVVEDNREHLLVYLFAMLLPFYADTLATWRALSATLAGLAFIVFMFWHLNLHYMNILFAFFNYRVFTLYPNADTNPLSGKMNYILITPRVVISAGERINAYRISDTVYFEPRQ
jgi:hypothetical protein